MVYDWDDKRDICYRMYVEEKKTLEQIVEYFRQELGFVPSRRAFQCQFKRWDFPLKQNRTQKNEALVERIRSLWQQNIMQKDMIPILHSEGFTISARELMRLRAKHEMYLRRPNGDVADLLNEHDDSTETNMQASAVQTTSASGQEDVIDRQLHNDFGIDDDLDRRERYRRRKLGNDVEPKRGKKRRGMSDKSGAPAEPSGPPRYPSETTIGEVRTFLQMDKSQYWEMRDQFEDICRRYGIIKKSISGPEPWQVAKNELIQTNPHLNQLFSHADANQLSPLQLSLDVVCMDVTKHIRNAPNTLTIAEAKNVLGIDPNQARALRDRFLQILASNGFINTFESDNANELKDKFVEETGLKQLIPAEEGPKREKVLKSIQLLCREYMKRWREQRAKKYGKPSDNAANRSYVAPPAQRDKRRQRSSIAPVSTVTNQGAQGEEQEREDDQIDPSLLLAASHPSLLEYSNATESAPPASMPAPYPLPSVLSSPVPAYFRLSLQSTVQGAPPVWLGALSSPTMQGLLSASLSFNGGHSVAVGRFDGVVINQNGSEMLFQIDREDELQAYLSHIGGSKATFVVQLQAK